MAQKVTQDQPDITRQVEQSVTLNCQYEVSWYMDYYSIFWYKQLPRGQMTYLIRQYSEDGNARDGRYSVNFQKADKSISLTIPALQLEDTAKYFCALRELTVVEVMGKAEQKTPELNKREPPCCRTSAEMHTCRSQQEMVTMWLLHLWSGS